MDVVDEMRWLVDSALDRAVVPGFSNEGYRLRQAASPDHRARPARRERSGLITAPHRGIGHAIAASLVRLGATVWAPRHR
ncbi:hypothetical protein [Mycobacterium shigaense]|uniref:Uncharacterized protein n=1 Tax=Mycobacterium shigaense TaxID=722731 RepID=A0A1Z4EFH7_9MYCO|nr:hypothetical protein [Mycobacterium shigaense]MEA1124754.1 hypothetical protein [Mycobacterium shigaense]PRI16430.1 hypothetical protein B2J96_06535 [Mycobacterium shigaense]BAX91699.1 hypothetical protein MSG_01543 [Mycobacterium shigaense]